MARQQSTRRRSSIDQPSLMVDQVVIKPSLSVRPSRRPTSCRSVSRRSRLRSHTHPLLQHPSTQSPTIIDNTRRSSPSSVRIGVITSGILQLAVCQRSYHFRNRLQSLIIMDARAVFGCYRFDYIIYFTRDNLHWLPIRQRVDFNDFNDFNLYLLYYIIILL